MRAAPRPRLEVLDLVLTSRCNLRCAYCFERARSNRSMSWEIVRAALDAALASKRPPVRVVFYGGEPALEFATIRRAVDYAASRLRFTLVSNGTLLGAAEIEFLATHRVALQVSFDGVAEAQALRGAATFEHLDALLDRVRRDHPRFHAGRFSVAATVSVPAIPHLARTIDYFLRKDVRDLRIAADTSCDEPWREESIAALDRQVAAAARLVRAHFRRTGRVPVNFFRKSPGRSVPRGRGIPVCGVALGGHAGVDVDGTLIPCGVLASSVQTFQPTTLGIGLSRCRFGDVRESGWQARLAEIPTAVRNLGLFHDRQDKYSSHGPCRDCRYLRSCAMCPAAIAQIPGNDDPRRVPDFACAFNRVWLKHRDRFPVVRPSSSAGEERRRSRLLRELAAFAEPAGPA